MELKAGMLIRHKSQLYNLNKWHDVLYVKKVTPKRFRIIQFGMSSEHSVNIINRLWRDEDMFYHRRLATDDDKKYLFDGLFSGKPISVY